jgi:hypothetical protein
MSERGVFAVDRGIWDDPDFANEPFTEREAWMWLVGAAAWEELRIRIDGHPLTLQRGEFCYAVRFLATKWSWSKSKVSRFIDSLKKRDMLRDTTRDATRDATHVYLISNYNKFQRVGLPQRDTGKDASRDASRDADGTPVGHLRDKEETLETLEENISSSAKADGRSLAKARLPKVEPEGFSEFWEKFPRKVGKQDALRAYRVEIKTTRPEIIIAGAVRYAALMSGKDPEHVKHPGGWLRGKRWEDTPTHVATTQGRRMWSL